MPRFTQMMDVIFGLTGWVDFANDINGVQSEGDEQEITENTIVEEENITGLE